MTKYNEAVVERAAEVGYERAAVECQAAWGEVSEEIRQPWRDGAIAMFDTLERAPWWREVGATYVVKAFQQFRIEIDGSSADERTSACDMRVSEIVRGNDRFFVDTRWEPEPEPLKVGDVLETVEDLERLPVGAILTDKDGDAWQQPADLVFKCIFPAESARAKDVVRYAPFTIRYIPEVDE